MKSFLTATAALILYLVLVPAIWLLVPLVLLLLKARLLPEHHPGSSFIGGDIAWTGGFNLRSPLYLAFAGVVFIAAFYWELRRLEVMPK